MTRTADADFEDSSGPSRPGCSASPRCSAVTGTRAEDLVQQALMRTYRSGTGWTLTRWRTYGGRWSTGSSRSVGGDGGEERPSDPVEAGWDTR